MINDYLFNFKMYVEPLGSWQVSGRDDDLRAKLGHYK
jgi:hypothetical protein